MKQNRCVIVGASPETDPSVILRNVTKEDFLICADGGYRLLASWGRQPDLWIGDFDSIPEPSEPPCEWIKLPTHKDDTDTLYCLREGIRRGYRDYLLLGMTGGRADHTFANYSVLLFLAHQGCHGVIRDSRSEIRLVTDSLELSERIGCGFGIFPFGCGACEVTLRGFAYEAEHLTLQADFPVGVSNTVTHSPALVLVHSGSALVIADLIKAE